MEARLNHSLLKPAKNLEQGSEGNKGALKKEMPKAFYSRSANRVLEDAMAKPIPKRLFGSFMFEEELTILYTKSNVGKSILAVQIANMIASGEQFGYLENESNPQRVMYFDFELSDSQFMFRYSQEYFDSKGKRKYHNNFQFHKNLEIIKMSDEVCPKGIDLVDYYFESIMSVCEEYNSRVIILDNLSFLTTKGLEKSENARELMNKLHLLAKQHRYAVLVVSHTPKIGNRAITLHDLAGSADIGKYSDACFVINDSEALGQPYKYLKQTKVRSCEKEYHSGNVLTLWMGKIEPNFLGFKFEDVDETYLSEQSHFIGSVGFDLDLSSDDSRVKAKSENMLLVKKALENNPNASSRELEAETGLSNKTCNKHRKTIEEYPQLFDGYSNPKTDEDEE
ncbi:AAA family ATPase [Flavobacteriaceae bacterium]|nr:AAA family ATPase [Flavobacteriaceae bacterium]